jgi:peptidoglycan/LPS O-acetylase OafA/YrhL
LSSFCSKYCDLFMIATILIIFGMPFFVKNQPWISLFLFPFLILGLCYNKSTSTKVLSSTFFVVLGDISYSVYLLHPVILDFCNKFIKKLFFLDKGLVIVIHTIVVLSVTLIVSYVSYLIIEGPARSNIYKFLTKKRDYRSSVTVLK